MLMPSTTTINTSAVPSLLPLKLSAPPVRAGTVLRPELQALLADVRLHPVTLLVAPAGYGKTTLLSQWVQELTRTNAPISWLALDSTERDPMLFLAYLIGAFQSTFPDVGAEAWRLLHTATQLERDWPLVSGALCADLQRKVPTTAFLFLDDLQSVAESAVITQILGYMLRAAPPTLHFVIASRRMPTFAPLARLRAEGQLLEMTQRDLHLSVDDVQVLLEGQGVILNASELALLMARTEGWALSVQLVARALAVQAPERRGPFLQALRGREAQLLDYLATEILADLPKEMIAFLRLAALPASFDADLLTEALERDDVDYLLGRAVALGLPVAPLDQRGNKMRFHPLWRELLLRDLPELHDSESLRMLHRRFGRAFKNRGELEAAFEHYAQAEAIDELARTLRECAWPLLRTPQRELVRRWLGRLPATIRDVDAELQHMWGVSLVAFDPAQAITTIERAIDLYRRDKLYGRELRALADLVAVLGWQTRPNDLVALCVRAIRAANRVRDPWSQGAARVCVSAILYSKGRFTAALRVARQALSYPLNTTWHWLLALTVGSICAEAGRPAEALAMLDQALETPHVDLDDRLRQNLLRLRAMALYELGQTTEALTLAIQAHRHLSDYYRGSVVGTSAMHLAMLLMLQGRVDEGMTYLAQARAAIHGTGALGSLASLQVLEVYSVLMRGQMTNAPGAVGSVVRRLQEPSPLGSDFRLWLLMVIVLGESGNEQRALDLLDSTIAHMQARGYRLFLACAYLYRAWLIGSSDPAAHRTALEQGWTLMEADNLHYLPLLSNKVIAQVARAGLRADIAPATIGGVLRHQLGEEAIELLQALLDTGDKHVRVHAAQLLGQYGSMAAYTAMRGLLKDRDAAVRRIAEAALTTLVYRPSYTLRIRTLGSFALWRGDQEVRDRDWRSSKARHLFQLLLTERGRTIARERILDVLWPELDTEAAANNLRVTMNRLSKAIDPDRPDGAPSSYIVQQGDTFCFNVECDYSIDAVEFAAAVTDGQQAEQRGVRHKAIACYRQAVALYQGPYLPDLLYEDWTVVERERLTLLFTDAALRLGALLLEEGQTHEAIGLAWRVLEQDQLQEDAYQLLMRAHAALGERSTALRVFARCTAVLRDELGVAPLDETVALFHAIRTMR